MRQALKEWAVICRLLERGWQTLLLRKGGLADQPEGLASGPQRFWLFPTWLHQQEQGVVPAAQPVLDLVRRERRDDGNVPIQLLAEIVHSQWLDDEQTVLRLAPCHFWTEATIRQRFHYRQPGLHLLVLRVYAVPEAVCIPDLPEYAGCRSWVQLASDLSDAEARPVLNDAEFALRLRQIESALGREVGHAS
ncbi:MAG: DUF1802 family protein [Gemmatales bacterium]|nr:DUF1802 family protein [Gemmatales bacterium]MDW8385469.1 DUF1802 family protein [Gemmatales bacterium]